MTNVLLVARDIEVGEAIVDDLVSAGYEVTWCPGPREPKFVCVAVRLAPCPLTAPADVVVVDGWLASDEARTGIPSWHLIRYYRKLGAPVVALVGPNGLPGPINDDGLVALDRDTAPEGIQRAIESLLKRPVVIQDATTVH